MEEKVKKFGRFFALLKRMPYRIDENERHSMIVLATGGRTNSLREMTQAEYKQLCDGLEFRQRRATTDLRHRRSCVLHQMQKMGVDTTDWSRIDALCMDPRIAGKRFAQLSDVELTALGKKLRGIERKGGFRASGEPSGTVAGREPSGEAPGTVARAAKKVATIVHIGNIISPTKGLAN